MSKTKIGTPRPPKNAGIKFQYGRLDGDYDFLVLYRDCEPCDRALVMQTFTSKTMHFDYKNHCPIFEDSFIEELIKRGYDPKTIKFSVEKLVKDDC